MTKHTLHNGRIANIERLRVLGAFGIVWFHCADAPLRSVGYAGLPIFLLIFVSLIATQPSVRDFKGFARSRVLRLLLPWLFWSAVYGIALIADHILHNEPVLEGFSINRFLVGTRIHLWYLPYSFGLALCLYFMHRIILKLHSFIFIMAILFLSGLILYIASIGLTHDIMVPFSQWIFALPAIPIGIAIGRSCCFTGKLRHMLLSAVALATVIYCLILSKTGYTDLVIPYGIAVTLVCIAYIWRGRYDRLTSIVAPLTYGIYLVHPLVGNIVNKVIAAEQWPWLNIVLVFFISALITLCIKKSFLRKFV